MQWLRWDMETFVYVDGFNLYYGCLKKSDYKWLNLGVLFRNMLGTGYSVERIKYFTARLKPSKDDPTIQYRQQAYLAALSTLPNLEIHDGTFSQRKQWMPRAEPSLLNFWSKKVRVIKREEKQSDVNLAVELVNDAWENRFECAVVVTDDTDLLAAMRLVRNRFRNKKLGLISPRGKFAFDLLRLADKDLRLPIRETDLAAAQFVDPVARAGNTPISKPSSW